MNSNSNYETLYGVSLLDDLHNYFPALLYDSSSFSSVRDVLDYAQHQTRQRFDLFSYGLREYQALHPPTNAYRRVVRTSVPSASVPASSRHPPTTTTTTIQVQLDATDEQEEEEQEEQEEQQASTLLTNALISLLQLPIGNRMPTQRHGTPTMDQFLQPVVVRPTQEQIDQNTTVGNLVSDTETTCAICQDSLTGEQEGRKLNACGHWFHRGCIDTWLSGNVHCPVCRHDIRDAQAAE